MTIPAWLVTLLPRAPSKAADVPASAQTAPEAEALRAARIAFDAGLKAYALKDFVAAIVSFERVLRYRHDDADAHNNLGLSCLGLGRGEDAMDAFVLAVHFRPHFPQALYNLALAAIVLGDFEQAVASLDQAIGLQPDYAAAHSTLGYLLSHQTGDFERGAAHIKRAFDLNPADPDVACNYSAVLVQEGHTGEALKICRQLLAACPDMHEARLNCAFALLKRGDYAEGWHAYEARKLARGNYVPRALTLPEWQGQPLPGKKLLIHAEQGIGDQIMFASCVPDVLNCVESCMLECAPPLVPLFRRSFPSAMIELQVQDDACLTRLAQSAGMDYQVAIGSLPARFRAGRSDFPCHTGYLKAAPERVAYWRRRLDALGKGPKIGISWFGGAASTRGASRSTRLADWLPILREPGRHFVNLQYGNTGEELLALMREQQVMVHDWREAFESYDETAALVTALELVISVQTALVHLAGALGKSAWVMLPAACEWRYGEDGEAMPWYPGVRLLRQPSAGDWQAVVRRIAQDVALLARL